MYTTSFSGLGRIAESGSRRSSFHGMNNLQLNDRGEIQPVDAMGERFYAISQTFVSGRRVRILIRGESFETFEETLMRFPDTLLGSRRKRRHYNPEKDAYVFKGRDKFAFNAILFFYQSGGILSRPSDVTLKTFVRELEFFELTNYCPDCWTLKTARVQVPEQYWCQTLWLLFEDPKHSWASWVVSWISCTCILAITALFCLETTETGNLLLCKQSSTSHASNAAHRAGFCHQKVAWFAIDSLVISWFLFEYAARLITAPNKFKFMFSFLGLVDLLSLVPYFGILVLDAQVEGSHQGIGTFLRVLRLLRVLRVLKLAYHIEALRLLGYTIHQCLYLLVGLMLLIAIITVALSSPIYLAEKPDPKSQINDTLDAAWFVVITLTNVGYGDVVPVTPLGKLLGTVAALLGILVVFILPAPVLLNQFEQIYSLRNERRKQKSGNTKCSLPDQLCD